MENDMTLWLQYDHNSQSVKTAILVYLKLEYRVNELR